MRAPGGFDRVELWGDPSDPPRVPTPKTTGALAGSRERCVYVYCETTRPDNNPNAKHLDPFTPTCQNW
jgi:hypothetical protein